MTYRNYENAYSQPLHHECLVKVTLCPYQYSSFIFIIA